MNGLEAQQKSRNPPGFTNKDPFLWFQMCENPCKELLLLVGGFNPSEQY